MKKNLLTIIISAVLAVIFVLLLFTFQVRTSEVAVVTTFGRTTREITEPRAFPFFKWPWPIQKVYKLDKRIQNFEDKFTEAFTADGNNLLTQVYVGWRITDAKAFFPKFAGGSTVAAERLLEDIVTAAKQSRVGQHPLGELVNADPRQLKFDAIEAEIRAQAQAQLALQNCGISIDYLGIKRLGLPESVTQSVFDRMTAERKGLADKLDAEGQAEARKIKSSADLAASKVISTAESKAREIRASGETVAADLLPAFQQNPELANFLSSLETLEASTRSKTTLIFDSRTLPFNLFTGSVTNK
ncbi:MAG TPA: protease modulator HflC [Verrucomicrobiae bacterium]|nr:protease modulator HflC [Verrucomicrobiae bacterium]